MSEKSHLQNHINSEHILGRAENYRAEISHALVPRDLFKQVCCFCGEVPGVVKFIGHLCHHLEEISISVFLVKGAEEVDDLISSLAAPRDDWDDRGFPCFVEHRVDNKESGRPHVDERSGVPIVATGAATFIARVTDALARKTRGGISHEAVENMTIAEHLGSKLPYRFDDYVFMHGTAVDFPEIPGEERRNDMPPKM